MASKGIEMFLALALLIMLCIGSKAQTQSGCTQALISMSPCLNYVTGNSSTPSSSCCSQLASVVQSQPQCLCSVLNGGGASFGITVNQTLALALPASCKVQTPSVSQCNVANGTSASAAIPAGSPGPADSSNETPEIPTAPSESDIPSGTGSKTVPSIGGASSRGSNISAPHFHFLAILIFIVSFASPNAILLSF